MSLTSQQTLNRQKIIGAALVCGFIGLLVFGLWVSDTRRGQLDPLERARLEAQELVTNYQDKTASELTPQDKWISKSEQELTNYKSENIDLNRRLNELELMITRIAQEKAKPTSAQVSAPPASQSNLLDTPLPPPRAPALSSPAQSPSVPPGGPTIGSFNAGPATQLASVPSGSMRSLPQMPNSEFGQELEVFTISEAEQNTQKKHVSHYLPAGSFVTVSLLSGVDAATGGASTKDAQPILMRVMDFGILPNHYRANIVDCHVTGSVRGDISSERARVRSEFLSCVFENGDIAEVKLEGWVNGEDGKDGFRGRLVEKSGALLARTFVSGMFSGLGNSIASQYQSVSQNALGTVTTVNPGDATKSGFAMGTSTAFDKLADYYMARANEIFPIIEVSSNRLGELVVQQGVDLGEAFEQQLEGGGR